MTKPFRRASVADHSTTRPDMVEADGAPTWVTRGANFVIAITHVKAGTRLAIAGAPDEHMIVFYETGGHVTVDGAARDIGANHLAIAPPGDCTIIAKASGTIVRCFTSRMASLLPFASNAAAYAKTWPELKPLNDWPPPVGGFALRVYDLQQGLAEGDKTRVYRSSNMMINLLRERTEPRDMRAMSPHSHDDFEQASITLSGVHVHYLRWPWTPDMSVWRADEAIEVGAPSVTVIPPPIIHTTRNVGVEPAVLIDIFAPPRADFSLRQGMVRNADDYPLPDTLRRS